MPSIPEPLLIQVLPHALGLPLPEYATAASAGLDLRAAIHTAWVLAPGQRALIPTGLCLKIPEGWEGQVRPRSGLALHHGVTVLNSPGTIDSDYRGEVGVILINLGEKDFVIQRGDRIAQLVIAAVAQVALHVVEALPESTRQGGFGSTGRN